MTTVNQLCQNKTVYYLCLIFSKPSWEMFTYLLVKLPDSMPIIGIATGADEFLNAH